jgi:hypothetical protein
VPIRGLSATKGDLLIRTALHVTLTPIVFLFPALMVANRVTSGAGAFAVMAGAVVLGALYGWKNRHR